jgi:hypothetical protein
MGGRRLSPRRSMAPRGANLPDVTRRAAPTLGISADLSRAAFARSRSRARAMDRPSQGRWAGPGMTGLLGTGPRAMPLRAAPGGSSGPQRVPPKTKRNAQPVLQTRPAGPAKWSLRLGRTCTQPALAQRLPESDPGLTIRALGMPSRTDTSGQPRLMQIGPDLPVRRRSRAKPRPRQCLPSS